MQSSAFSLDGHKTNNLLGEYDIGYKTTTTNTV